MDYEKALKNAKLFAIGILVLLIINFCMQLFGNQSNLITIIFGITQLIIVILTIKGLNDNKIYGAICGIIVSVLLILARDIISLIFGILYLIDCIKLVNYMKNN